MDIVICSGVGTGDTTLAAFDNALQEAGIHNFNLIKLSSIIPPKAKLTEQKFAPDQDNFGNKLYVVMAEERTDLLGRSIAAGIGWYQWGDGRGVFAEQHDIVEALDAKEAEGNVYKKLKTTVLNLCQFRDIPFEEINFQTKISATEVKAKPACVLVAAVYQSEPW